MPDVVLNRAGQPADGPSSGFLFRAAPFASCHASTLASTGGTLVCAWFAGTAEGAADTAIWLARSADGRHWDAPRKIVDSAFLSIAEPAWNPVLHDHPSGLLLYFRLGATPRRWRSFLARSQDGGQSWSRPGPLPDGFLGPIKNKPLAQGGRLLCPSSTEGLGWQSHIEFHDPTADRWERGPVLNRPWHYLAIQPTLLDHGGGRLQALCRTRNRVVTSCRSEDGGRSWSAMTATVIANPNSGIDAVSLVDGRHLLVCNPVARGRSPLALMISGDGTDWQTLRRLDEGPGEYSYPAIIQDGTGAIHVSWTWRRTHIRHARLDSSAL